MPEWKITVGNKKELVIPNDAQMLSADALLPSQIGNSGRYLSTNGITASWKESGGSIPKGTGFRHVIDGTEDPQSKLVENIDVSDIAAILESKLALNYATHSNVNDPTTDQKSALIGTSGVPSAKNKYVTDEDPRNTDARVPIGHNHILTSGAIDVTATAKELNVLDGIPPTLTSVELGYVSGARSSIQAQIDQVLPSQIGNSGKYLTTNGNAPSWGDVTGASKIVSDSYIIYNDGSTTKAVNGTTGFVDYSGIDAVKVINSAIGNLSPGRIWKEKVLLKSNFVLSSSIIMASYTILELDGKVTMNTNSNSIMISGNTKTNFDVIGGDWDGNRTNQSGSGTSLRGFEFVSCSDYTIDGCVVHDCKRDNICNNYGTRFVVINCVSYNCMSACGLAMNFTNDGKALNNTIHDCDAGLYLYCQADSIVQHCERNIISNNLIYNIVRDGISLYPEEAMDFMRWNVVSNNILCDCGTDTYHSGIGIGWGGGVTVGNAYYNTCTGNVIYSSGKYNNGNPHILVKGKYNVISGNCMYNSYKAGMYITGNDNIIIGNVIDTTRADSGFGMELVDSSYNTIQGNHISNTGNDGIYLVKDVTTGCNYNNIANNYINKTGKNWLEINDIGSTGNIIENNFFSGEGGVLNSGTNTIFHNNDGFVTENNVISPEFSIDSNGIKTIIIAHGLSITPNIQDCYINVIDKDPNIQIDDWAYNLLKLYKTDSKYVYAKINVSTKSEIVGATAKLGLKIS